MATSARSAASRTGTLTGPQEQLNAFGLRTAYDTYRAELTGDVTAVHGADGGESVCGGYGRMPAWLPWPLLLWPGSRTDRKVKTSSGFLHTARAHALILRQFCRTLSVSAGEAHQLKHSVTPLCGCDSSCWVTLGRADCHLARGRGGGVQEAG
ncbi:hypothetical protein GCM10022284_68510 [Streptomyces hundungensis]